MKKRLTAILLVLVLGILLGGCGASAGTDDSRSLVIYTEEETAGLVIFDEEETTEAVTSAETEKVSSTKKQKSEKSTKQTTTSAKPAETVPAAPPEDEPLPASVEKDGSYTTPEDVAEYIHTFGTLPANFITKKQAQKLGWDSSAGNLDEVAPGRSIGGDYFGNREGLLPEGSYHECDVNYSGGYRGAERLIYGDDGSIYYTNDHYRTFTQLY